MKFKLQFTIAVIFAAYSSPIRADPAMFSVQPAAGSVALGDTFFVDLSISSVVDLFAWQFDLSFDPGKVSAIDVTEGSVLSSVGATAYIPGTIDNITGLISFTSASLVGTGPGPSGSGVVASIRFSAAGLGSTNLTLSNVILLDSNLADIAASLANSSVTVSGTAAAVPEPRHWLVPAVALCLLASRRRRVRNSH